MDIGKLGRMLLDMGDRRQANVRCNGMQALRALRVVLNVAQRCRIRYAQHVSEMPYGNGIVRKITIDTHHKRGAVGDKLYAVSVEDATARGGRGDRTRLVILR